MRHRYIFLLIVYSFLFTSTCLSSVGVLRTADSVALYFVWILTVYKRLFKPSTTVCQISTPHPILEYCQLLHSPFSQVLPVEIQKNDEVQINQFAHQCMNS